MISWVGSGFGIMEAILSDNGGEFSAEETREVASILDIEVYTTAAESPFQNGLCERNHAVIDTMLLKLEAQCPDTPLDVLLAWANNAKNSLQMWHGFSSFQLVLGRNPNLPSIMNETPPALEGVTTSEALARHLNGLHAARQSFIESEADERIRRALRSKMRASEERYEHGDRVYYKRAIQDRWMGPGKVVFQDGKVIFVRHGGTFVRVSPNRLMKAGSEFSKSSPDDITSEGKEDQRYRENKFEDKKRSYTPPAVEEIMGALPEQKAESSDVHLKKDDRIQYKENEDGDWKSAAIISRAGKATGQYKNWYNIREESGNEKSVDLGDVGSWRIVVDNEEEVNIVLIPKNRHGEDSCVKAKREELRKLENFGTHEEVADTGQSRISTTWVLWHKGDEVRARLVARGFEDESIHRKDSPTVTKSAMRIILTVAASRKWQVQTTDIKSAFLQGKKIERDVYLIPPKEANVAPGNIWKLRRCLYGLNDAARHFFKSVVLELKQLGCQQSTLDPAVFLLKSEGNILGVIACHIDDFLHAGNAMFDEMIMKKMRERFLAGKLEAGDFRYVGFELKQLEDGISLDQTAYVRALENGTIDPGRAKQKEDLLSAAEQTLLRQLVGRLSWAVQGSRPDLAFEMIELSTKLKNGHVADLIRAVKVIRKLKDEPARITFAALGNPTTWKMVTYTDAAHANVNGVASVGGHIVLLVNDSGDCSPIEWKSNKIKRVVRSTLAAEALSLQEGLEDTIYLRTLVGEMVGIEPETIPIVAITDNKSVREAILSTKMVDDRRLRIDIAALKETVLGAQGVKLMWCPGDAQLANCLTKRGASPYDVLKVLQTGHINIYGAE